MTANVKIWRFDSHDLSKVEVEYIDEHGRYGNAIADQTMIKHLLAHFTSTHPTKTDIALLSSGDGKTTFALARDVLNEGVMYLVCVVEL